MSATLPSITTEVPMPDAQDYRDAALHLRRLGAQLAQDVLAVRPHPDPALIAGGPIGSIIDASLDLVRAEVERACAELDRLAAICDRRAEICAGFAAEVIRHRRLVETIGRWASPPSPPAWWVEP